MANVLRIKRRWSGATGGPASLKSGELAYNGMDDVLYIGFGDDGAGNATSIKAVAGFGASLMLTTDQTAAGIKTFTSSPIVPTLSAADNSTKVANSAFVQAAIAAAVSASTVPDGDKGDITVSSSGSVWTIDNNSVTNAKAADMPANTMKGNNTGASADPIDLTVSQVKTLLALNNVDNTSDANKPVSTAQAAAIALKADLSLVGAANGIAPLDSGSKVPAAYLPAYVDDVLEYANLAAFPATGSTGTIYVALDTNKTYRWSGTVYVEISPSPGSTDAVPEGSVNLYYTAARAQADVVVDSIADADTTHAPSRNAVFDALALKQPLDATLTALAAANWVANSIPIGSGADTLSQVAFAANTFPARSSTGNLVAKPITDAALSVLDDTTTAAMLTTLGAQPLDATLTALAGANWAADSLPIGTGADTLSQVVFGANTFPAKASTGALVAKTITDAALTVLDDTTTAAMLNTLGGQPVDATLTAIAALVTANNQGIYATGVDTFAMYNLSAGGRALANAAGTANTFPYFSAANTVTLAAITAAGLAILDDADATAQRTTLGLGTMATQNASAVAITGGTIDGVTLDGGTF